jgi:hypothetical protein
MNPRDAGATLLLYLIGGAILCVVSGVVTVVAWPDPVVCEISGDLGSCGDEEGSPVGVVLSLAVGVVGFCLLFVSLVGYGVKLGKQAAEAESA